MPRCLTEVPRLYVRVFARSLSPVFLGWMICVALSVCGTIAIVLLLEGQSNKFSDSHTTRVLSEHQVHLFLSHLVGGFSFEALVLRHQRGADPNVGDAIGGIDRERTADIDDGKSSEGFVRAVGWMRVCGAGLILSGFC